MEREEPELLWIGQEVKIIRNPPSYPNFYGRIISTLDGVNDWSDGRGMRVLDGATRQEWDFGGRPPYSKKVIPLE